jgi:hypothetical protein
MTGARDGAGIGPNFEVAKSAILRVPVLACICRCAGGVVVKNGCANRSGGDLPGLALGCFALLAMVNPPKNFLTTNLVIKEECFAKKNFLRRGINGVYLSFPLSPTSMSQYRAAGRAVVRR